MIFDYKNILIMGYGASGKAVEKILKTNNINYTVYDKNIKITGGNYLCRLSKRILENFDLLVVSPGISVYNKYIILAEKMGIKVVGELEFGYWFTSSPVIAITGTNGKTTTTTLINQIVQTSYKSDAFGNIGTPLSTAYQKQLDYLVCEVSSFQLETTYSFNPYISVILNIAEDHIDRHKNFNNYINCKLGLIKNSNEKSLMVLNADDKIIMERTKEIKAKKYYISKYKKVKGVYIQNNSIYANLNNSPKEILSLDILEDYMGIMEDVLASILVSLLLKIDQEKILSVVNNFKVANHRLQNIGNKNGVTYINDSKSTNIHSTVNAINSLSKNIILLIGGKNKDLNFDNLFKDYKEKLSYVVCFGNARKQIIKSAKKSGFENICMKKYFVDAVRYACACAKEKDIVLLSPACASFDEFKNYAERGESFQKIVKEIIDAKY